MAMSKTKALLTLREIARCIYLSGANPDYQVHHNIDGEAIVCHVPSVSIGNAIVRALRDRQEKIRILGNRS